MIHVCFGDELPPEEWLEKAKRVNEQLEAAATEEERNKIIDANSHLWGELKEWLLKFSRGKCWFSEAKDAYSHWDVEHFRPKKRAKELDGSEREGYWWLAFDWRNYRICGNVGNRKKGTYFPLCAGSQVGSSKARYLVQDEVFLLLDPARPGDAELLSFNEEGLATPMPGIGAWPTQRAVDSMRIYKLNEHEALREARQKTWMKCRKWIEEARNALEAGPSTVTAGAKLQSAFVALRAMLNPDEPFTAVVRECLNVSGYRWAQRIASP